MTRVAQLRPTIHQRVNDLEDKAKLHEKMAPQVDEMYQLLTRWKNLNWFAVKIGTLIGGSLGAVAVLLTILDKVGTLLGHR